MMVEVSCEKKKNGDVIDDVSVWFHHQYGGPYPTTDFPD